LNLGAKLELIVPGSLRTRTGGFIYARRMVEQLRSGGWQVQVHELDPSFPQPTPRALQAAAAIFARIPRRRTVVIDGLALGGMPAIAEREAARLRLIALIHHPLAFEKGLAKATQEALRISEQRALAAVAHVIVPSETTAQVLTEYAVTPERISIVPPGTDPAPLATGSGGQQWDLLCVATLTPRKGHAILIDALAELHDRPWRLQCVGSRTRDPQTALALQAQIATRGLQHRISLCGELEGSALLQAYRSADLFVLASYYEGYGMVLTEALAHGLPIVATTGGAVAQTLPPSAGLLVPSGDRLALCSALARLFDDPSLLANLRAGARQARHSLPSWQLAGERFAAAILRMVVS
jgi:glycosyltransferase involved in cell wall biosynthesis